MLIIQTFIAKNDHKKQTAVTSYDCLRETTKSPVESASMTSRKVRVFSSKAMVADVPLCLFYPFRLICPNLVCYITNLGTNCAPLIADLFLYCYERDFMSDLQKSKRHDLIDMFNDTSRYLDDIFTIDNPEFEKYIPDIYPAELQLNKANTSDKETSFLDLNIKVIGSDIHTSVYDKRDDFGFPIVNFPWLSGDVPRLPPYGIYISQLVRFARCCTSVLDFHSKNLQITSKLLTQGYRYHKLRKTFGKFFRSYSELLSKFGDISFQEYIFKGISHPVFYGDLVYKLRRVKDTPNFISSGSKIVKRLRRRQYDPLVIETTIGLELGPCTALCRLFLKHCTLTNKAVGTI